MKSILKLFILGCCFIPGLLCSQEIEVKRERVFPATAMYGYMNGGTDQFLEYGVQKLTVSDIVYKGEDYTVEVYDMPSVEDAFGIYSLHVFKCNRADYNGIDCLSSYQLQAVCGNVYLSVVFPSGSDSARINADYIREKYLPCSAENKTFIPKLMGNIQPTSGNIKYLRGPLSLSKTNSSLNTLLKNIEYSGVWYLSDKDENIYKALIYFSINEDVERLSKLLPSEDILKLGENYIYLKGKEKEEAEEDFGNFGF